MVHPFASHSIISTTDTELAQTVLSKELSDLRLKRVRDSRSFHLQMNGIHLGRTALVYNRFDADTVVDPGEIDGAILLFIGDGTPSVIDIDGEPVVCREQGAILSPSRRVVIDRPAGSGAFILRADFSVLEERLQTVLDRCGKRSIVFDRSVDLASGRGRQIRQLLRLITDSIHRDNALLENPLLRAGFDDMILNALLELPSNYSDELQSDHSPSVPSGIVRRAEEYLRAHAAETIGITDVLSQCGCSRKTLFAAFRRHRDYTPMQFLLETRLKAARDALRCPSPNETVTSIALGHGFSHLGRFSEAYRTRFGESPSETLRHAKRMFGA